MLLPLGTSAGVDRGRAEGVTIASGTSEQPATAVEGTSEEPERRTAIGTGVLLTVVAWFLSRCVVGAGWGPARNPLIFDPYLWGRWDSINYFGIAQHGRTFGRCGSPGLPATGLTHMLHLVWCGSAGWLPGYPWLIRGLGTTGISVADAGLIISWVAMAAALFLVWLGWARDLAPGRALLVLLAFGLFPGSVYNFAFFPTSLALACTVGAVLAATRERFLTGAVLFTLAGLCYPSAWFAAAGVAVGLVLLALPLGAGAVVRRALWGLAGLISLLVLGIHDQIAFGHYNAFVLMDAAPSLRAPGFPGRDLWRLVFQRTTSEQIRIGRFGAAVLAVQAVVAACLTGGALLVSAIAWRRRTLVAAQLYPALLALGVVLGVVIDSATGGAWNRSIVLAAPVVVCLRRQPIAMLALIVVLMGTTTASISHFFFTSTLV